MNQKEQKKQMKAFKIILLIVFFTLLVFLGIKLLPLFKDLTTEEGRISFESRIKGMGISGAFMLIGLIFIQILIAFLPGEPLEILAGMCYGTFWGMILVFVGVFLSTTIIYFSVKKFGKNFITTFFGEDGLKKIQKNKLFKNPKKVEMAFLILFFIPGTPKDLFTYIGAITPIDARKFLLIATFARFPSVITSTFAGANIAKGNIHLTIISFVVAVILSCIGIAVFNKMDRTSH